MKKEFTLKYRDHYHYVFLFECSNNQEEKTGGFPFVRVKLYRKDLPDFTWTWQQTLVPSEKIEFHLIYGDGLSIKGNFHLFHAVQTNEDFIFLDTMFGEFFEEHFEGNIFELGKRGHHHHHHHHNPVQPILPPDDDPGSSISDEQVRPAGYQDLFPYLYLQYWPSLPAAAEAAFIEYTDILMSPPAADLYANLLALKKDSQPRVAMEQEALAYINGTASYNNAFITDTRTLPFPFDVYPKIYDILYRHDKHTHWNTLFQLLGNEIIDWDDIAPLLSTTAYAQGINNIWQNLIALNIINGYQVFTQEQLIKILVIDHLLQTAQKDIAEGMNDNWHQLIRASVVLPGDLFRLPAYTDSAAGQPKKPLYTGAVIPYAIGDLQMVQHYHTGYEPGEIAMIENVSAGEMKKVKNSKRRVIEEITDEENTKEYEQEQHSSGEQLEKEVLKTLQQTVSDTHDFSQLTTSYGPPTTGTYGGSVTKTSTTNPSFRDATQFARKVLAETVQHISQKVYTRRKTSSRDETEDVVIRTLDNRRGDKNIRSIYRWLNKVYKMRLINYGKRFMTEFIIEKPSWTTNDGNTDLFSLPLLPPDKLATPVSSFEDITANNFISLGSYYQVPDLPLPPVSTKIVTVIINEESFFPAYSIPVPEGYLPDSITVAYKINQPATLIAGIQAQDLANEESVITITDPLGIKSSSPPGGSSREASCEANAVPVLLEMQTILASPPVIPSFYLSITMNCSLTPNAFAAWQLKTYGLLRKGYDLQQQRYEGYIQQQNNFNRQSENKALRRSVLSACNELLWQIHENINGSMPPLLSPPEEEVDKPGYKQFFEEAFEWEEMSFSAEDQPGLGRKEDLLYAMENQFHDNSTSSFMKAKRLRVLVPVRSHQQFKVLYYLSSGIPFYGHDHLTPVFENNKSIVASLKQASETHSKDKVKEIDSWHITVPTQMQWLQDNDHLPAFTDNKT